MRPSSDTSPPDPLVSFYLLIFKQYPHTVSLSLNTLTHAFHCLCNGLSVVIASLKYAFVSALPSVDTSAGVFSVFSTYCSI